MAKKTNKKKTKKSKAAKTAPVEIEAVENTEPEEPIEDITDEAPVVEEAAPETVEVETAPEPVEEVETAPEPVEEAAPEPVEEVEEVDPFAALSEAMSNSDFDLAFAVINDTHALPPVASRTDRRACLRFLHGGHEIPEELEKVDLFAAKHCEIAASFNEHFAGKRWPLLALGQTVEINGHDATIHGIGQTGIEVLIAGNTDVRHGFHDKFPYGSRVVISNYPLRVKSAISRSQTVLLEFEETEHFDYVVNKIQPEDYSTWPKLLS